MEEKSFTSGHASGDWELLRMLRKDLAKFPVLSREEEIAVARRALAGDQDAIDLLVESNIRYVIYVVCKRRYPGLPVMDLISEGCIGLLDAVKTFDPEQGYRFIAHAYYPIKTHVYAVNKDYYRNKHRSLDDPISDDGTETTFKDLLASNEPGADVTTANRQTHHALMALDERERKIIYLRYWRDLDQEETARKIRLSRSRVAQIENGALRKMRWSMNGNFSTDSQTTPKLAGVVCCEA